MRYRLRFALRIEDVGSRVSVRTRLADGSFSDVVGLLESFDGETIGVRDRDGKLRVLPRSALVAGKVVGPATPRSRE